MQAENALSGVEWDESAKEVLRLAREKSFAVGDEYIGTQHLLLAAVTFTPLNVHGINSLQHDIIMEAIRETIGFRDANTALLTPGARTPRTKLALCAAADRALNASRAVTVKDIWSALLADPDSDCSKILRHLQIDIDAISQLFS